MCRLALPLSIVVAVLIGLAAASSSFPTVAEEGTPAAMTPGHPLIGAWLADVDAEDPRNPPSLFIFHDDGTYIQTDADGSNGVGVWEATGPDTAMVTVLFHALDETGEFGGTAKVRANVEIDPAGDTFTAQYTLELFGPDGSSSGQLGPGTATAERITIEPMGTPVGPIAMGEMGTPTP